MTHSHRGRCLCGAIRFDIAGPMASVVVCHCEMCRRFHGHFGAYSTAKLADFSYLTAARPAWYQSSPFARRAFCPTCGSSLFWERLDSGQIDVAVGCLDQPTGLAIGKHIYVTDKGDYYELTDGLPQHPASPG